MPAVTYVGKNSTGHDICPPIGLAEGSSNVYIDGKPCGRVDDAYELHSCIAHPPHSGKIKNGSPNVFVNGKPIGRIGDEVFCESVGIKSAVQEGSDNVFANDKS